MKQLLNLRKTFTGSLIALVLATAIPAHAGGSSFAGGFAGGLAAGVVNGVIQAATNRPQTVVVRERTVVVHDHASSSKQSSHKVSHANEAPALKPTPAPEATPATPAPTPETAAQAQTPTPATETKPVVNREPVYATTNPVKIDHPTDLTARESALLTDKEAVMHYFDDFFKRTRPDFSVADSSLFMEVQIGAYNYLVAKIAMNTPSGATLEQGFVVDMKNEYCTVLNLDAYHEFMHTGNIVLLGEKHLNPLED
jgi:hypothetical protein